MVYLARTSTFLKDWEEGWEQLVALSKHCQDAYPEVVESYLMTNIAGPTDQIHWILTFEGLAEEDSFSNKVFKDETYMKTMAGLDGVISPPVDNLYRRET